MVHRKKNKSHSRSPASRRTDQNEGKKSASRLSHSPEIMDPPLFNATIIHDGMKDGNSSRRGLWKMRRVHSFLGVVAGIFLAQYFDVYHKYARISLGLNFDFPDHVKDFLHIPGLFDLKLDNYRDEFYALIDFEPPQNLLFSPTNQSSASASEWNLQKHMTQKHPIVMIPGFTSTGLEIWDGRPCGKKYFRQRMWGTYRMLSQFMIHQKCWLEHLMMNSTTGLDPDGIKLRPAYGLEAADFVIGSYWVWGKIIENLADLGYDSNSMFMASYDWRLSPHLLEERDKYFTKLLSMIELARKTNNHHKVVLASHSFGSTLILYFFQWVSHPEGGQKSETWVDENIQAFINVAGPLLGLPKTLSTLLSGEMKDTAELGTMARVLEYFFTPASRSALVRTWSSLYSMFPRGGTSVWGNETYAPDDALTFDGSQSGQEADPELLQEHLRTQGSNGKFDHSHESIGSENYEAFLKSVDPVMEHMYELVNHHHPENALWTDPTSSPLPNAPSMKIYCFYGVGNPTERSYYYYDDSKNEEQEGESVAHVPHRMDTNLNKPFIQAGVRYSDGDGTVPLVSLGHMCVRGWKSKVLNPGSIQVITREHYHAPVSMIIDSRGGPETSDHVDIMGNSDVIRSILSVSAGKGQHVEERIISSIHDISQDIVEQQERGNSDEYHSSEICPWQE